MDRCCQRVLGGGAGTVSKLSIELDSVGGRVSLRPARVANATSGTPQNPYRIDPAHVDPSLTRCSPFCPVEWQINLKSKTKERNNLRWLGAATRKQGVRPAALLADIQLGRDLNSIVVSPAVSVSPTSVSSPLPPGFYMLQLRQPSEHLSTM